METKKIKILIKEAQQGNASSQYELGLCFYNGDQVKQNYERAIHWFTKAYEDGNTDAAFYLGQCNRIGLGCEQNTDKAIEYFEKASKAGHPMASYILGTIYYNSNDRDKQQKAFDLFLTGAKDGVVESMYNTAVCYSDGIGVAKDPVQAYFWYQETCKKKYPMGQYSLGRCYEFGLGVFAYDEMAFFWYLKSANNGYPEGMMSLASCYERGFGCDVDDNLAGLWYNKAFEAGLAAAEEKAKCFKKKFNKYYRVEEKNADKQVSN